MQRFEKESSVLPGLQVYTFSPPIRPSGTPQGLPFQMVPKTPTGSYQDLYQYGREIERVRTEER
ncbi:hypothetical protein O9993_19170 [Vibrio lentus]|nr:hypothetical protein [Vibrio lentus]